ncbi:MAG: hypothetical protein LC676_06575 [Loktanella sp.]|nr:hypothetical protein [Loktanella sp.]
MAVLLTRRAVVQAQMEASYNAGAAFTADDGVLVSEPDYSVDPNVLERDFTRDTLSTTPHIIGRKLSSMTFRTEMRGNGKAQSGLAADATIITRLFRACGYAMQGHTDPFVKGPFAVADPKTRVTWAVDASAAANTQAIAYTLRVTTAGASGAAEVEVFSDITGEESAPAVITDGTQFPVGTEGVELTPTFTGDLELGDEWVLWLMPSGIELKPISDNFVSVALRMFKDGVMHDMPGCYGTFEIEAQAGDYARISWTFTGTWAVPVDQVMPTPDYERTLPSQVELSRLRIRDFKAVVETFSYNQQNDIQPRPDVSSEEGYIGTRLVSRDPEGGINPEADLVASHDFWRYMADATRMPFQMRVGYQRGNTVWVIAPGVQYTGLTYQDRQGILSYDAGLKFPSHRGDDEVFFIWV